MMRVTTLLIGATGALLLAGAQAPASADFARNPDGFGIYSPEAPLRGRPRVYRYDPYSWYYKQQGYYPYYASDYWVPRRDMRYRYRYVYQGPHYQYVPSWGYDWWACGRRRCH